MNTPPFTGSYVAVLQPKERTDSPGVWQFGLMALFDEDADFTEMNAALRAAKIDMWGPDPKKWPGANWRAGMDEKLKMYSPWRKQDELIVIDKTTNSPLLDQNTGLAVLRPGAKRGCYFLNLHTRGRKSEEECEQDRPDVVDHDMIRITDPKLLYSGARYIADVGAFAYFKSPKAFGATFGLNHVQKIGDGTALGGRIPVSAAFVKVKKVGVTPAGTGFDNGAEDDEDPLAGLGME